MYHDPELPQCSNHCDFCLPGLRIQEKCWNRSEFGVLIKWEELNWNDGGKLFEQSCCCALNLKGWRNWNIFQIGLRNTECKWWRLGASDSIGYEVGSVVLTGN